MYDVPSFDISQVFAFLYEFINAFLFGEDGGTLGVWWANFYPSFKASSTFISLFLMTGLIYTLIRLGQIRAYEEKMLDSGEPLFGLKPKETLNNEAGPTGRERWLLVGKHLSSTNPSDWRLAILEADIILDELTKRMNPAENLGERLKQFDKNNFTTLDKAWEAHKIRNAIAHQGVNFMISQREARRIIELYESVFREFNYV